jgi:quercetin dioxygenase-like cupin family protein
MQTLDIPQIDGLVKEFLKEEQVECPVNHAFAPDIYVREIFMPAGTVVIGHKHLTEHFNVILKGKCRVIIGDVVQELTAPCTFVSAAGAQKIVNVLEDCIWQTIHSNTDNERDIDTLEDKYVDKACSPKLTTEQEEKLLT